MRRERLFASACALALASMLAFAACDRDAVSDGPPVTVAAPPADLSPRAPLAAIRRAITSGS